MLLITSVIAAALTLIFIKLSFNVIGLRRKNKVSLGSGGHEDLERAIRAQANFSEYVPIGIILLACLELNGAPWWLVLVPLTKTNVFDKFSCLPQQASIDRGFPYLYQSPTVQQDLPSPPL